MTLADLLDEGVSIYGNTSVKLVGGILVKFQGTSKRSLPLECDFEGRVVTIAWYDDENELVVIEADNGKSVVDDEILNTEIDCEDD